MATGQSKEHTRVRGSQERKLPSVSGGIRTDATITFQVHGLPAPQGSTRAFVVKGKPIITSTAKGLSAWRRLVADVAQDFAPEQPWEGPVGIDLHFETKIGAEDPTSLARQASRFGQAYPGSFRRAHLRRFRR